MKNCSYRLSKLIVIKHLGRNLRLSALLLTASAALRAADPAPAATATSASDKTVVLDPFEVSTTSDKSYGELNSNSITAFKTELDKMPVSADVFDQAFMNDTGLNSVESVLSLYSAGSGQFSSQPDTSAANNQYLDRNAASSLSLRGLQSPTVMINGFFPVGGSGITGAGVSSTFDIDKIEVINGPQALLYGVSGAGGVINLTLKQGLFSKAAFGSAKFQVDQYGNKLGQLDYGVGNDRVAVRIALIDQNIGDRRLFYGGPMKGDYAQLAVRPFRNTTVRLSYENQTFNRTNANSGLLALTAASTSNDARNGQYLNYLIATSQLGVAANGGQTGAGAIPGINWTTVASLAGDFSGEYRDMHQYIMNIDTIWASWLSSQVSVGYRQLTDSKIGNSGITYDAPNVTANPTGTFAVVLGTSAESMLWEPTRQKVARISALADNKLFGDRIHSQTIVGADATRTDGATISEYYVAADSNFNPVMTGTTVNNGYTIMPTEYWAVPNGPVQYPLGFNPGNPKITYAGTNYVRAVTNQSNPALVSASNPEGLTGTGLADYRHSTDVQSGVYAANYSDFFNGNLSTLGGLRVGKVYDRGVNEASAPNPPSILSEVQTKFTAFNAGLNFKIVNGLRGYVEFSDNYDPPGNATVDPYGNPMKVAHGLGEEAGLKATAARWNLSGSLAVYHASSTNEELSFTSTISRDINPSGLNGIYNAGSNLINVDRKTQGVQLTATAAPGDWRLRLSASTIKSTIGNAVSYGQLYNDQFHQDAAGDVTFADGSIVYVSPTFNSKAAVLAATQSTAPAGYIPLTIASMNNPASSYYANPAPVSAEIGTSPNVSKILTIVDPVHGAILTGKNGQPISMLQIAPNPTSPPPGNIVVTEPGDSVSGFPRYSVNFVGVYTVPSGLFKGVLLGGTTSIAWKTSMYYYYPLGVSNVDSSRIMLYEPTETLFGAIIGYSHKFNRVTFSTQMNINNLMNHYHVLLLPSYVSGWAGPNNATIDQRPRYWTWSSTIGF